MIAAKMANTDAGIIPTTVASPIDKLLELMVVFVASAPR